MIMVRGEVNGKEYTEPFSKGILSRSLIIVELTPTRAYTIATEVEEEILRQNLTEVTTDEIAEIASNILKSKDPLRAEKYLNWRKIKKCKDPLIILIGGASGVGTSSIAFELASRLGIKSMISTDMIREVMRKIVSKELSPVIHSSSFAAHQSMKVAPPPEFDFVLAGFKEQVATVSVGVEAVIERALTEGISIVIEGVHIVPGFIKDDLMEKDNILMFSMFLSDEDMHKDRFHSRCRDEWNNRPLQRYLDNFNSIRKTQRYIVNQAKTEGVPVIDNIEVATTIDYILETITKSYGGINDDKQDKS